VYIRAKLHEIGLTTEDIDNLSTQDVFNYMDYIKTERERKNWEQIALINYYILSTAKPQKESGGKIIMDESAIKQNNESKKEILKYLCGWKEPAKKVLSPDERAERLRQAFPDRGFSLTKNINKSNT